jgi:hypothetical protein
MACVNINLPAFKRLEAKFGFTVAEAMSKQMGDIPTIEKAFKYIRDIKMNTTNDVMQYLASGPIYEKSILMSKLRGIVHSYEGNLLVTTGLPETSLMESKKLIDLTAKEISIKYPILFYNMTILERIMDTYPGLLSYQPSSTGRSYVVNINSKYLTELQEELNKEEEIAETPTTEDVVSDYQPDLFSYDEVIEEAVDESIVEEEEGLKKIQEEENKSELKSVGLQLTMDFDNIVDGLEFLSPENKQDLKKAIDEGDVPLICDL